MPALVDRWRTQAPVKDWVPTPVAYGYIPPTTYVRPADWITLTAPTVGQQKFVGVHAVYNHGSNFVAFTCAGAYTVDWGDGSAAQNVATGVTAYHNYVYTDLSSGTLSTRGYRQALVTITPQGGSNLTSINLNVLHNQSGLATGYMSGWLDIKIAGTLLSSLTIGASSQNTVHGLLEQFEYVGANALFTMNSQFRNCYRLQNLIALDTTRVSSSGNFSDMFNACYSLQTVPTFDLTGSNTGGFPPTTCSQTFLNCFNLVSIGNLNFSTITSMANFFQNCRALRVGPKLINTQNVTNFNNTFSGCDDLQTVPWFDTRSATTMTTMFTLCRSLTTVPCFNTTNCTNLSGMFQQAYNIQWVPKFNTPAVNNFSQMFYQCYALKEAPALNTSSGNNFANMFLNCGSLQTAPAFTTSLGGTITGMFSSCSALTSVPAYTLSGVTDISFLFLFCTALKVAPTLTTSSATNFSGMFQGCSALVTVPLYNTAAGTNFTSMFQDCKALQTVPDFVTTAGTNFTSMYQGCTSLEAMPASSVANATAGNLLSIVGSCPSIRQGAFVGVAQNFSVQSCGLGPTELDAVYTALASGVTSKTITVTGNWGVASDTPTIATGKGWTVTGS